MSDNESNGRRSKRAKIAKKESNLALLSNLKNARDRGTNHKEEYEEEEIYDYVSEDEYEKIIKKRMDGNVVGEDSEYYDDGREIYEQDNQENIVNSKKRKKPMKNNNIKNPKSDAKSGKTVQKDVRDMLAKAPSSKKLPESEDFNDLLQGYVSTATNKNMDFQVKPKKPANPFSKSAEKTKFNPDQRRHEPTKPKLVANKMPVRATREITLPKVAALPLAPAFDSDDDDFMSSMDHEPSVLKTQTPVSAPEELVPVVSAFDDFPEFDDDDFADLVNDDKGFCDESKTKSEAPTVMWGCDDQMVSAGTVASNQDLVYAQDEDKTLTKVYWIDAYHDAKIPGVVFLFGKTYEESTKTFVNCCVKICDLERRLYFLPRDDCDMVQLRNELVSVFDKYNVQTFRCKAVNRNYAFELVEIPDKAEYMMVQYNAKEALLPSDLTGKTFSHVFGCGTSILELLILDLKLKGPCWLNLANLKASSTKFSISKYDYEINGIKGISKCEGKLTSPPMTLMSINVKTVVDPKTSSNEIVSVGCFIHNDISFDQPPSTKMYHSYYTFITNPKGSVIPYDLKSKMGSPAWKEQYKDSVSVECSERALISNLLATIHKNNPDIIVGHSLFGHQLQILLQRCKVLNINFWHRLGRLNRNVSLAKIMGRSNPWLKRMATAGRLLCDTEFSCRELVHCRSYELSEMIKNVLPEKLHGLQNLSNVYANVDLTQLFVDYNSVKKLIDLTMDEAIANIYLMHELQILPLAHQISALCGNLIARTLSTGKSERIEYLLLHAFTEKDYITPDKYSQSKDNKDDLGFDEPEEDIETTGKRKPTYAGGIVLEPKKGFYENLILLMDFNSLYPSIIQEYNICFTTIDRHQYLSATTTDNNDADKAEIAASKLEKLLELATNARAEQPGILPIEIRKLVESRKQVKALLLNPDLSNEKKMQYDIRQKALKITANSTYGCLGFRHSRFKATQLASLITFKGRDILQGTKALVESGSISYKINNVPTKMKLEIVYGDTDSIMVDTGLSKMSDYETVIGYGKRIKEEINKIHKNIQIDVESVFRRLLLLRKKKYAALKIVKNYKTGKLEMKQELKGLEIVRRDWCKLVREVGQNVLTKILEGEMSQEELTLEIGDYLTSVKDNVISSQIMLDKFVITKGLGRNPETYTNQTGQPHVQVAMRHNKSGAAKKFLAQDTVEYVICTDGSTKSAMDRAYSPSEVKNSKNTLKIDTQYYLVQQVHSVISRMVDGIDDLNSAFIAERLGLDSTKYGKSTAKADIYEEEELAMSGADKFKCCKPLMVECLNCRTMNELSSPIVANTSAARKLWPCVNCKAEIITAKSINFVLNSLTRTIGQYRSTYYHMVYECQDLLCGYKCREAPVVGRVGGKWCFTSTGQWMCPHCNEGIMKALLDHSELYNQIMFFDYLFTDKKKDEALITIRAHIDSVLKKSAYCTVDLSKFAAIFV